MGEKEVQAIDYDELRRNYNKCVKGKDINSYNSVLYLQRNLRELLPLSN